MWDDGTPDGVYSGFIHALGRDTTQTYHGHAFKMFNDAGEHVITLKMNSNRNLYFIPPKEDDYEIINGAEYKHAVKERTFMEDYRERTGYPYLSYYSPDGPRVPPVTTIWPAAHVGQKHEIVTSFGHYTCSPLEPNCTPPASMSVFLQVLSLKPRVFVLENLLSAWECDHIVSIGEKVVARSTVGHGADGFESQTRTSSTGWINRDYDKSISQIFARFADVLGMDRNNRRSTEELQIVRYGVGQEYLPHHDFSDEGSVNVRFLTLLLHIAPSEEGGATGFPKAAGGLGLEVRPSKGSALLFYNMLPDGNGDDFSLHTGRRIDRGVKWACNLWVWDPKYGNR